MRIVVVVETDELIFGKVAVPDGVPPSHPADSPPLHPEQLTTCAPLANVEASPW